MSYFIKVCQEMGIPCVITEYKFHPTRKWRCDYFIPIENSIIKGVSIELEGGVWASTQGRKSRHFHGKGIVKDMEKYNALSEEHILLLRFEPSKIDYNLIEKVYNGLIDHREAGET